jgi:hypothetical protein
MGVGLSSKVGIFEANHLWDEEIGAILTLKGFMNIFVNKTIGSTSCVSLNAFL